ncbi:MAG: hypothetical protein RIB32_00610 [Phycisphaerales bacterium]
MRQPKTPARRNHTVAMTKGHDSGLPLIIGLVGYVALLPLLAFGVCAVTLFT